MSNETTNPVAKWILIGVIAVSLCAISVCIVLMIVPVKEYRVAHELKVRGFRIEYEQQDNSFWQYPTRVWGSDRKITEDDSRLIGQLPHLLVLGFEHCDLSGLNLDDITNCQKLVNIHCEDVNQFHVDEIKKLAVCPIQAFTFRNARLNDSVLEDFAKFTQLEYLYLDNNSGITDAGLEHLEKIASLKELYLMGTSVTDEGFVEFRKKRSDMKNVGF